MGITLSSWSLTAIVDGSLRRDEAVQNRRIGKYVVGQGKEEGYPSNTKVSPSPKPVTHTSTVMSPAIHAAPLDR